MISNSILQRLKAQLLATGLQTKDFPLYQVINQLIDATQQVVASTVTSGSTVSSPGSVVTNTIPQLIILQGEDGEDGTIGPPGVGRDGAIGAQGGEGNPGMSGIDGEDGIDGDPGIQGPQGFAGSQGSEGPPGIPGFDGFDGEDGAEGLQGPQGMQGLPGTNGTIGIDGVQGPPGLDAEETEYPYIIPGPAGGSAVATDYGSLSRTLTNAEVNAALTTPITLLAAAGANKVIMPLMVLFKVSRSAPLHSADPYWYLRWISAGTQLMIGNPNFYLTGGADGTAYWMYPITATPYAMGYGGVDPTNKPLLLQASANNTNGSGVSIRVTVFYCILTFNS